MCLLTKASTLASRETPCNLCSQFSRYREHTCTMAHSVVAGDDESPEQAVATALADNLRTISQGSKCDNSYRTEWRRYVKWAKQEAQCPGPHPPCLTRNNIDLYFQREVAKRAGARGTISRVKNALQWFANNDASEHLGKGFVVRSALTDTAQEAQILNNKSSGGTANPGGDPHKGLKDNLPVPERIKIMKYVYKCRRDWGPCSVNICTIFRLPLALG